MQQQIFRFVHDPCLLVVHSYLRSRPSVKVSEILGAIGVSRLLRVTGLRARRRRAGNEIRFQLSG